MKAFGLLSKSVTEPWSSHGRPGNLDVLRAKKLQCFDKGEINTLGCSSRNPKTFKFQKFPALIKLSRSALGSLVVWCILCQTLFLFVTPPFCHL